MLLLVSIFAVLLPSLILFDSGPPFVSITASVLLAKSSHYNWAKPAPKMVSDVKSSLIKGKI
jgi:hypothetical protein